MKILYFDITAFVIQVILLISLIFRKMITGRANKFFVFLLAQVMVTTIIDFWSELYPTWLPVNESNTTLRWVMCFFYYIFRNFNPVVYQMFLFAVTDTWHILKKSRILKFLLFVPYIIDFVILLTNPLTNSVFYFDENLVFHRGPLIYILYVISFFYFTCAIIFLTRYKKLLTTGKYISLLSMYFLNLIAILIQLFYPELLIEMFMTTLTMLLLSLTVQRVEETVNPVLGVRSYISYSTDMKKAYAINKHTTTILVKIIECETLLSTLEYDAGNDFLKKVGARLAPHKEDRFSADVYYLEKGLFAVVTDNNMPEKIMKLAERISAGLNRKLHINHLDYTLKPCVCVLRSPEDIDNYENLLSFGKSFHNFFPYGNTVNEVSSIKNQRMFMLQNDIRNIINTAIANRSFKMYYQPIYSVKDKKFLSAEALIRLNDEKYGFIPPDLFITEAEKNGTILKIGDFVLDDVCRFLSDCQKNGLPIHYIEINLSMHQCMQADLMETVHYYLNKYNLKPNQINLEITETAASEARDIVEDNINKLTSQGISFSLDDYGTGYSNIARIMELPFSIVKLDKSLTDKVDDSRMKILLKNTVNMLKEIGMKIVVEGVETKETLQQFVDMDCDYIQGYYFSKPLPEDDFVEFIKNNS